MNHYVWPIVTGAEGADTPPDRVHPTGDLWGGVRMSAAVLDEGPVEEALRKLDLSLSELRADFAAVIRERRSRPLVAEAV